MRLLFIGDVVGDPGVAILARAVPWLVEREGIHLVVANAENASGGAGMSPAIYRKVRHAGVDVVTMGDHIYKKMELIKKMKEGEPILKPANYPPDAPGQEFVLAMAKDGTRVGVFSLLGRLFMRPVDCPFLAADRVLETLRKETPVILLDLHAEATGDKAVLGRYLDGKVSAVLGTHTHVATADERILPNGTAFVSDVGMTGPYESILGRRIDRVMFTNRSFVPSMFDVATEDVRLSGAIVDVDAATGKATAIKRVQVRGEELGPVPVQGTES